ncbi:MAG: L-lactate permease [Oscillospiraceae bacterium]|nr:L-lactate permease [Oscillospiraceae bacterium]
MTVLSLLPILCLLVLLIVIKVSVARAGAISLVATLVIALVFFGLSAFGLLVAVGKALSLALFVSLIVWAALLLYHLVDGFKAIDVINKNFVILVEDKFVGFLLLSWLFTGVFQGMAGFGVPVVIVAPILIALGFDKVKSLSATLLGHTWAVTFGSMGAAFFIIQMLTGLPYESLGTPMWIFNTIIIFGTGIGICWLYDGIKGIGKGISYVIPVSVIMAVTQFFIIRLGLYSLASLLTAVVGLAAMLALYKLRAKQKSKAGLYSAELTLFQSVLPYAVILVMAMLFQFLPDALRDISLSFAFPGTETSIGHIVSPETGYARIRLFGHPAVLLLIACAVAIIVYKRAGAWDSAVFKDALRKTAKKGIPATLALLALGNMSLIMMDSGMTNLLSYNVAGITGRFYPFVAPFFGVLGSFLTGNNTNSNILFGSFQYAIAQRLDVSTAVMSAVQSLSGGIGVAIGPTLVLMGALASKLEGQESLIYRKLIGIVLIIALVMGIANFVVLRLV